MKLLFKLKCLQIKSKSLPTPVINKHPVNRNSSKVHNQWWMSNNQHKQTTVSRSRTMKSASHHPQPPNANMRNKTTVKRLGTASSAKDSAWLGRRKVKWRQLVLLWWFRALLLLILVICLLCKVLFAPSWFLLLCGLLLYLVFGPKYSNSWSPLATQVWYQNSK
jgi:hypothetical protein